MRWTTPLLMMVAVAGGVGPASAQPAVAASPAQPAIVLPRPLIEGFAPDIRINGLRPRETVRVFGLRMFSRWEEATPGNWRPVPAPVVSWADVTADRRGMVDLGRAQVRQGSWRGADPYGLFWSGRRPGSAAGASLPALPSGVRLDALRDGDTRMLVARGDAIVAQMPLRYASPPNLRITEVTRGGWHGVYAAPQGGRRLPTLILLHGSEGGDRDGARQLAARFAGQGFAALTLNYFAWDFKNLPDIPNVHVNVPIERIADARDWLATQAETDTGRIGLYGHSKGAEFATVAAVRYPWIRAVAACVPSDSVWEGYGLDDERARRGAETRIRPTQISSWSWQGRPLDYIRLRGLSPDFFDNTERYERSRNDDPARAAAALIPIERSRAHFLLLGGGRDEVWASGAMARSLGARMRRAGQGGRVTVRVFDTAGHSICGEGSYPTNLWADASDDPRRKDPDAEGPATIESWRLMVDFFRRRLR